MKLSDVYKIAESANAEWFEAAFGPEYIDKAREDAIKSGLDFEIMGSNSVFGVGSVRISGPANKLREFMIRWGYDPEDYGL